MTLRDAEHTIATIIVVAALGVTFGLWTGAAVTMCALWIGREIAQAEYRWIEHFGDGKRANMPFWGPLDPRVWDFHSMVNWLGPIAVAVPVIILSGN